jgi:hypothetical protein
VTTAAHALTLLLAFSGFAALALSLDRHHRAAFRTPVPRRRVGGLRAAGWSGLALAFAAAVGSSGWTFGPVQWVGSLTASALAVVPSSHCRSPPPCCRLRSRIECAAPEDLLRLNRHRADMKRSLLPARRP